MITKLCLQKCLHLYLCVGAHIICFGRLFQSVFWYRIGLIFREHHLGSMDSLNSILPNAVSLYEVRLPCRRMPIHQMLIPWMPFRRKAIHEVLFRRMVIRPIPYGECHLEECSFPKFVEWRLTQCRVDLANVDLLNVRSLNAVSPSVN